MKQYICEQCGSGDTSIEFVQCLDRHGNYDESPIVICRECDYVIPKTELDIAMLLDVCKDGLKYLDTLWGCGNVVEIRNRAAFRKKLEETLGKVESND